MENNQEQIKLKIIHGIIKNKNCISLVVEKMNNYFVVLNFVIYILLSFNCIFIVSILLLLYIYKIDF